MSLMRRVRTVTTGVGGTPWYSNLYFENGPGTIQSHIDAVRDFWTALAPLIKNNVSMVVEGDVAIVESTTNDIVGVSSATSRTIAGSNTGAALPPANQIVVNWLTGTFSGGRQIRGKTFVFNIAASQADSAGGVSVTARGSVITAAQALVTASVTPGKLLVFSRSLGTVAIVQTPAVGIKFGVLRSRRD